MSWHRNQHAFDQKHPTWFMTELSKLKNNESEAHILEFTSKLHLGAFYLVKLHENGEFYILHLQKTQNLSQKQADSPNISDNEPHSQLDINSEKTDDNKPTDSDAIPGFLISFVLRPYQIPKDKRKTHGEDELVESNHLFVPSVLIFQWMRLAVGDNISDPRMMELKLLTYTSYCRYKTVMSKLCRYVDLKRINITESEQECIEQKSQHLGIGSVKNTNDVKNRVIVAFCRATVTSFRFLTQALNRNTVNCKLQPHEDFNFFNDLGHQHHPSGRRRESHKRSDASYKEEKITKPRSRVKSEKPDSNRPKPQDQQEDMIIDSTAGENYQHFINFVENHWNNEEEFNVEHQEYMQNHGKAFVKVPVIGFVKANLYVMFLGVIRKGGFKRVCRDHLWKEIYFLLQPKSEITNATTCTRRHYEKLLYDFEKEMLHQFEIMENEQNERRLDEESDPKIGRNGRKTIQEMNVIERSSETSPWKKSGVRKRKLMHPHSESTKTNASHEIPPYFSVDWILASKPENSNKRVRISPESNSYMNMRYENRTTYSSNHSPYYQAFDTNSMLKNARRYENSISSTPNGMFDSSIPSYFSNSSPLQPGFHRFDNKKHSYLNCEPNCQCFNYQMMHSDESQYYSNTYNSMSHI